MTLIDFWKFAAELKEEARRGWIQRLGLSQVESVADHSYGVALLSLYEGIRRGYDIERVLKLALVHDLEEAITGDMTPLDKRGKSGVEIFQTKRRAESRILRKMPVAIKKELRALWMDLRNGRSREARLVKDLDRLEMALQADRYQGRGAGRKSHSEFYRSAIRVMRDADLKGIVRGLGSTKRG